MNISFHINISLPTCSSTTQPNIVLTTTSSTTTTAEIGIQTDEESIFNALKIQDIHVENCDIDAQYVMPTEIEIHTNGESKFDDLNNQEIKIENCDNDSQCIIPSTEEVECENGYEFIKSDITYGCSSEVQNVSCDQCEFDTLTTTTSEQKEEKIDFFDYTYDEIFYTNLIEVLSKKSDIKFEDIFWLSLGKFDFNIVQGLFGQLALIQVWNNIQSKKILIKNAKFQKYDGSAFCYVSPQDIFYQNDIRLGKTKVLITKNSNPLRTLICTVMSNDSDGIIFQPRNGNLSIQERLNDSFTITMYPNKKQLEYAKRGINAIAENPEMLNRLWIGYNRKADPLFRIIKSKSCSRTGTGINRDLISTAESFTNILVCSPSDEQVQHFATNLWNYEKEVRWKRGNKNRLDVNIARIVTLKTDFNLHEITVELSQIKNFSKYDIICCTLGVAPKLAEKGLKNLHMLYIDSADAASEMLVWMVIGSFKMEKTLIKLAGNPNNNEVKFEADILRHEYIGYSESMFERLCRLPAIENEIDEIGCENIKRITIDL